MSITIECQVKQLGRKRALLDMVALSLPLTAGKQITLRTLLIEVVKYEVARHNNKCESLELLTVLQPEEVLDAAEAGKVSFGDIYNKTPATLEKAIDTALQAFDDGLYFVFVDESKIEDLNGEVVLSENSSLLFLRLTMLAGGWFV